MTQAESPQLLNGQFAQIYSAQPTHIVFAPGRVDLMGSHTDYNQGYVLTLPINRTTWIAARPRQDGQVNIRSLNLEGASSFSLAAIQRDEHHPWVDYVRGVAAMLQESGYPLSGFDGLISSSVPLRSGLSSSAALEVATARLFQRLGGLAIDPVELALICQRAENQFVGMNCGILDQYTASVGVVGQALLLDCRALTSQHAPLSPEIAIVICDTRSKRELTGSEYPQRRAHCERGAAILAALIPGVKTLRDVAPNQFQEHADQLPPDVRRRCRFIIEENQRVLDLSCALPAGDGEQIKKLTQASYHGARELYEIVSLEMDEMMTAMLEAPGAIGARQAGAGFGGCMVAFVQAHAVAEFSAQVSQAYFKATQVEPQIYTVSGDG